MLPVLIAVIPYLAIIIHRLLETGSLSRNFMLLAPASLVALAAAWLVGDKFVVRPVNRLLAATRRLGGGDVSARSSISEGQGEISELGSAFNDMAGSLETLLSELKQSQSQIQSQQQRLRALHEINAAVSSTLDLRSNLSLLLEKVDQLLPYASAAIRLLDSETKQLGPVAWRNVDEKDWKNYLEKTGGGLSQIVFASKSTLVVPNLQTDARVRDHEIFRKHGLVSYIGLPLIAHGEALGSIAFFTSAEHDFHAEEIDFLTTLANQAAIAIHNSRLFEQVKQEAVALETAAKVKSDFFGFVSHELKTPLSAIMGYARLLRERALGDINKEQEAFLTNIIARSMDLSDMIQSIMEATRIEFGAVSLESSELNLGRFLDNLRAGYDVLPNDEVILSWQYNAGLPPIRTDAQKLKHILENLINNAIKYTEKGSVVVEARDLPEQERVVFTVSDTGVGIAREEIPFIFEKFRQLRDFKAHQDGVGLGLHIVKTFTDLLGGTLDVKSEVGKGSTFSVTLPYEPTENLLEEPAAAAGHKIHANSQVRDEPSVGKPRFSGRIS
jgi:signal transduction histidine kinase/HAMP domain-containing protein